MSYHQYKKLRYRDNDYTGRFHICIFMIVEILNMDSRALNDLATHLSERQTAWI